MLGEWCYQKRVNNTAIYLKGKCEDEKDNSPLPENTITVGAMRVDGWEFQCNVTRITEIVRGKAYTLERFCGYLGTFANDRTNFNLSSDHKFLFLKTEWESKERVEKNIN